MIIIYCKTGESATDKLLDCRLSEDFIFLLLQAVSWFKKEREKKHQRGGHKSNIIFSRNRLYKLDQYEHVLFGMADLVYSIHLKYDYIT